MIASSEELVAGLVEGRHGRRFNVGSYVFEPDALSLVMLKWEGDTDQLHGIEPLAHLSAGARAVGPRPPARRARWRPSSATTPRRCSRRSST